MAYDNLARNVAKMAARGRKTTEIMRETGCTRAEIAAVLADPAAAIARYQKEEIPAKYRAAKMLHSARPAACVGCRWAHSRCGTCAGLPRCFREVFG